MALKSAPYYWVECDRCGQRCPPKDSEFTAWSDRESALCCAFESGWGTEGDLHLCPDCLAAADAEQDEE